MALEFRILGRFELLDGGRPVRLTAHKPRALLAMLLLHAGELVPWRRLLDELWDGEPPRSAIPNLRTYATDLRRTVFQDGDQLTAEPGGYRLQLCRETVDLAEFDRLCTQARQRYLAGQLQPAESAYAGALRLWRGPPLAGLRTGRVLAAAATALDERRVGVVEDAFDVRLDLFGVGHGGGPELVADLRRHVAAHPLRERPRRQLMVALYRVGDIAGSLEAYAEAREALRESLGLDPDHKLERLHAAVLTRSVDLLRPGFPDRLGRPPQPAAVAPGADPFRPAPVTNGAPAPRAPDRPPQVAVCGSAPCSEEERSHAEEVGRRLARRGAVVLCGGEGGLMAAVAAGAREERGVVIAAGPAPGTDEAAPPWSAFVASVVTWSADAVIVVGGSWGALCQIAAAVCRGGVPVVALGGWMVLDSKGQPAPGVQVADSPASAVKLAIG